MKKLFTVAAAATFALATVACNKSEPGGPGATKSGGDSPDRNNTFQISLPTIPTHIKQGTTESVKVSIDRGSSFKQGVKLSVKSPDKVKGEFDRTMVDAAGSPDVNLKITPDADAPTGDVTFTITGTPESGPPTSKELSIKVTAK